MAPASFIGFLLQEAQLSLCGQAADSARPSNDSVDARHLLAARATTIDPVTCGYADGDKARPRTAEPGYNCRVDVSNGLWGFCPTSVLYAPDCGLAAACIDTGSCSRGCGNLDDASLTTFTCTGKGQSYCSTVLLDSGPDQTYRYIACAASPARDTLLAAATDDSTPSSTTTAPSSSSSSNTSTTPTPGSGLSSAPQPSSTASSTPAVSTSDNTGAIVGGVVGGLAIVCLTVLAVVLVMRRGRHRRDQEESVAAAATTGDGYGPVGNGPGEMPAAELEHAHKTTYAQAPVPVAELAAYNDQAYPAELYESPRQQQQQ